MQLLTISIIHICHTPFSEEKENTFCRKIEGIAPKHYWPIPLVHNIQDFFKMYYYLAYAKIPESKN